MSVRSALSRWASVALVVCCLALAAWFVAENPEQIKQASAEMTSLQLSIAFALSLLAMVAMLLSWTHVVRSLDIPISLRVARGIFPLAQLGKYIPGGIWPVMAQATLGRQAGLPAASMGAAGVVNLALSIGVALVVSGLLVVGPRPPSFGVWPLLAAATGVLLIVSLSPPFTSQVCAALRHTRGASFFQRAVPRSGREIRLAVAWCLAAHLVCGVHILVLIPHTEFSLSSMLYASAAYALSAVAGVLVVFAPAGAGVREATMIVLLQPVATPAEALVVAIASRLLLTVSELALAAAQARHIRDVLLKSTS